MAPLFHRVMSGLLLLAMPATTGAVTTLPPPRWTMPEHRDTVISRRMIRATQFAAVAHLTQRWGCESVHPPQPLTTPDPLVTFSKLAGRVMVSFIIGTDGHVYSPLVMESGGLARDRHVLQTVRTWRFRPATCNGVPTETEGKIEFFQPVD